MDEREAHLVSCEGPKACHQLFIINKTGGKLQLPFEASGGFNFMRRFVSYTGIILLALFVCGWGSTLAGVLCPHAGMNQALPMAEDHSCCRAKLETTGAHQHQGARHEAAHGAKMKPLAFAHDHSGQHLSVSQPAGTCAHCLGQSELPAVPASVRELTLQRMDACQLVVSKTTLTAPPLAVSVSRFAPSQHAPPGLAARKHLVLGVFLI